jgi:cytochrome c oxidase subunit 3
MSTVAIQPIQQDTNPNNHKAQRFTMRMAIVTITMSFAGLTSYYIVRQAAGNWHAFELPPIFWISTLLIGLSSLSLQFAHRSNRKKHVGGLKLGLGLTVLLGFAFCVFQWLGWQQLQGAGVFLSGGNISGSIFYVITGGHAVHVLGGLFFLLLATMRTFWLFDRKKLTNTYLNEEFDKLNIRTDLLTVYWHFMGVLWLYLFIFLSMNH